MNLKPFKTIYIGLTTSFVFLLNAVVQFINIYRNDGPKALGFFFFLAVFIMLVFIVIYIVDLFNKNYNIIQATLVSKHKNIIYVLKENGKVKRIRIVIPEILNKLVPGQKLEITLSALTSIPFHINVIDSSNAGRLKEQMVKFSSHRAWANEQVIEAMKINEHTIPMEKPLSLLNHILAAEKVWLARINEIDASAILIWPKYTFEQCQRIAEQNKTNYETLFSRLVEADFEKEISYSNSTGLTFTTTKSDMLNQVFLHGSYHRGQIATLLRQAGAEPKNTDYITYVRQLD